MSELFFIAEIGVNHNGSIEAAKQLILEAKKSGASAVKFQSYSTEHLAKKITPKVSYQLRDVSSDSHFEMLAKLELSHKAQEELFMFCRREGIEFMSTPYSKQEAVFLYELGVKRFKTASADIVDHPMHEFIASLGLQTFVSTGMASDSEISSTLKFYRNANCPIVLMHTTSIYPCPIERANMRRLAHLKFFCANDLGFSDHTQGNISGMTAVALGATFFEKHFTLNKYDKGPDHLASVEPHEFASYVNDLGLAARSLGVTHPSFSGEELEMRRVSRKSLIYKTHLASGCTVDKASLDSIRPGDGIFWTDYLQIVGKRLNRNVECGEFVKLSDFDDGVFE